MLEKCNECNNEVSDLATVCPYCAYPISTEKLKEIILIPFFNFIKE